MRESLNDSLELMFGHEGGYVNRASDKGGPTKYGITAATLAEWRGHAVTAADVQNLRIDEAEQIYRKGYWGQAGGDVLPAGLDYAAFDFGVNSGPVTAVKKLQQVLGVEADGWIGPATLKAVSSYPGGVSKLIEAYCARRMQFLRSLTNKKTGFPVNGRGWTIRVTGVDPLGKYPKAAGVLGNALAMAKREGLKANPMPFEISVEAKAKADPVQATIMRAISKPEVALPAVGAAASAAAPIVAGSNSLQLAISFGIVVVIVIGAIYAVRRILRAGAI